MNQWYYWGYIQNFVGLFTKRRWHKGNSIIKISPYHVGYSQSYITGTLTQITENSVVPLESLPSPANYWLYNLGRVQLNLVIFSFFLRLMRCIYFLKLKWNACNIYFLGLNYSLFFFPEEIHAFWKKKYIIGCHPVLSFYKSFHKNY